MAKSDVEKVTEEWIAKGGVLVRFYLDMQDNEKSRLQPILADLVNEHLMKEAGVVYCYGAIEEPLEREGVFITSATITLLFDSFMPLIGVAFRYAPAGIEILRPEKGMHFNIGQLQSLLMDISGISIQYSNFILEKVMKPEDVDKMKRQMDNRAETGKKFLEKRKKEDEDQK